MNMSWNHRALKWALFVMSLGCFVMVVWMLESIWVKSEEYGMRVSVAGSVLGVRGIRWFGSVEWYAFVLTLAPWMLLQAVVLMWRRQVRAWLAFGCAAGSLLSAVFVYSWIAGPGTDEPWAEMSVDLFPSLWLLGAMGFYVLAEAVMSFAEGRRG